MNTSDKKQDDEELARLGRKLERSVVRVIQSAYAAKKAREKRERKQ